jgi:hypothetical protein
LLFIQKFAYEGVRWKPGPLNNVRLTAAAPTILMDPEPSAVWDVVASHDTPAGRGLPQALPTLVAKLSDKVWND